MTGDMAHLLRLSHLEDIDSVVLAQIEDFWIVTEIVRPLVSCLNCIGAGDFPKLLNHPAMSSDEACHQLFQEICWQEKYRITLPVQVIVVIWILWQLSSLFMFLIICVFCFSVRSLLLHQKTSSLTQFTWLSRSHSTSSSLLVKWCFLSLVLSSPTHRYFFTTLHYLSTLPPVDLNIYVSVSLNYIIVLYSVLCLWPRLFYNMSFFCFFKAPSNMKAVLQAGWLFTVAIGNFIVLIVAELAKLPKQVKSNGLTLIKLKPNAETLKALL